MRPTALLAAATVLVTAGCATEAAVNRRPHSGTGSASAASGGVQQVTLTTGGDYRFHPSTIVVHPGRVRIVLVNTGGQGAGAPHNWSLNGFPGDAVPLTRSGERSQITFTAPAPGTYTFICTIHVKQGQTGTLVVRSS
jgi:plastocyanin